jgi:protein-disulfide isomerase
MEENKKETPILLPSAEKKEEENKCPDDKKIKNLISAVILLVGLFIGSIFVDVAQMVKGNGFSQRILNKTDVFALNGKTWVAYSEPIVKLQVISDDSCETCNPDEALVWLRRVAPTILPQKIDANSEEGKSVMASVNLKTIPAFIFSGEIEKTDFYQQASTLFNKKGDQFVLQTVELGLPVGKYIEAPAVSDDDIQVGNKESKVKVVIFSDFQCPYCKVLHLTIIGKAIKDYGDKVLFVFKQFPLDMHPQAGSAALAAECANEQGKFSPYADKLFNLQDDWGKSTGTQKFKTYAVQLGLNASQFNSCLDEKKYQDKIDKSISEGKDFSVSGTPSVFINDQFKGGASSYEEIKALIEKELAK